MKWVILKTQKMGFIQNLSCFSRGFESSAELYLFLQVLGHSRFWTKAFYELLPRLNP